MLKPKHKISKEQLENMVLLKENPFRGINIGILYVPRKLTIEEYSILRPSLMSGDILTAEIIIL